VWVHLEMSLLLALGYCCVEWILLADILKIGRLFLCRFLPSLLGRCEFAYFFILWGGTKSTKYCGHFLPVVHAPDNRWGWLWSNWWNEDWQGKPKYSEKTCPSATLSTTNPTWPGPGPNPGRRDGKPATNRLSYGAAFNLRIGVDAGMDFLLFFIGFQVELSCRVRLAI
jgi:hypothetical protein